MICSNGRQRNSLCSPSFSSRALGARQRFLICKRAAHLKDGYRQCDVGTNARNDMAHCVVPKHPGPAVLGAPAAGRRRSGDGGGGVGRPTVCTAQDLSQESTFRDLVDQQRRVEPPKLAPSVRPRGEGPAMVRQGRIVLSVQPGGEWIDRPELARSGR